MNLKLITLLFFINLIFIQCTNTNSVNQSNDQKCIEKVIAEDEKIGKIRNHNCEKRSLSETILIYTKGMENFDFSDCPKTFEIAFEKHKKAWLAMLEVTDKHPDLRGEMHDLFDELEKGEDAELFKSLLKDIWDTWGEIEEEMKKNKD